MPSRGQRRQKDTEIDDESEMDVDTEETQSDVESDDGYESSGYASSESSSLISKPPGEVNRPGRGGYNLKEALSVHGWNTKQFSKCKVQIGRAHV